ncbi:MAG: Flp pilus assembly complex ATPase component TadA [Piscirickettsiaceae bacterium]|nr:Flp pilus assembly complex ATPase component TadA [Piscirickettsiaceae bacterium]
MTTKVIRIGDALLKANLVTREQMEMALQKQVVTNERLGELLLRLGVVSEYDLASLLAKQKGVEYGDVSTIGKPDKDVLSLFNQEFCINRGFLPIRREGDVLVVVIGNADAVEVEQAVTRRIGLPCLILQGEFSKVLQAIRHNFYFNDNPVDALFAKEIKRLEKDSDEVLAPDTLINHLLHFAVRERASDIHVQPEQKSIHLSFRIDGVMIPMIALSHQLRRLIAAIKMRSGMDISDNLRPQDGSFSVKIIDTNYDIRVSTLITEYGENVVMRLLSSGEQVLGLNQLDFYPQDVARLERMFDNPHGILLMTGPTGSGKSTTLHAGVRTKKMTGKNILTVEDPIEYKLPIICQTEVNRKAGYTFASAIRQFLRHDPDVMLVGEIRDAETASAAITASETGHLVLSTLHVNNVLGVIPRFQSLNIPAQMVADTLIGVVNQRLSRRICTHCRESYTPTEHELKYFPDENVTELFRGKGCDSCRNTGYLGRIPIYEILEINSVLAELIAEGAPRSQIYQAMKDSDYEPIETIALRRVRDGVITINEAERLLGNSLKGSVK